MTAFLLLLVLCMYAGAQKTVQEDYSWRDYVGTIPWDALSHGLDKNGHPVYLGQTLFEGKLIPGQIVDGDDKVYFEWAGAEQSSNQNVKILCSNNAENFVWVTTNNTQVPYLTNNILIIGGYEPNHSTYIGRIEENGVTKVGKVVCNTNDCYGLYITGDGKGELRGNFQVLTYKRNKWYPQESSTTRI